MNKEPQAHCIKTNLITCNIINQHYKEFSLLMMSVDMKSCFL
jgi:hypothetical protein